MELFPNKMKFIFKFIDRESKSWSGEEYKSHSFKNNYIFSSNNDGNSVATWANRMTLFSRKQDF